MHLNAWPTDDFELDYSGYTNEPVPPQYVTVLNTSAPMTVMDYSGTTPEVPSVYTANNIDGELPIFMHEAGNALTQFFKAYDSVAHTGIVPPGSQLNPP